MDRIPETIFESDNAHPTEQSQQPQQQQFHPQQHQQHIRPPPHPLPFLSENMPLELNNNLKSSSASPFYYNNRPQQQQQMEPQQHQPPHLSLRLPSVPLKRHEQPTGNSGFPPNHPLAGLASAQSIQQAQASRLQYYHSRAPVYVPKPSFGLKDFELLDTLGK